MCVILRSPTTIFIAPLGHTKTLGLIGYCQKNREQEFKGMPHKPHYYEKQNKSIYNKHMLKKPLVFSRSKTILTYLD